MSQSILQDSDSVLAKDDGLNLEKVQVIKTLTPIKTKTASSCQEIF